MKKRSTAIHISKSRAIRNQQPQSEKREIMHRRLLRAVTTAIAVVVFSAAVAQAEQFVLFDVTFTYTKDDADNSQPSKSHYYIKGDKLNPNRPQDWTRPVDYRNGAVH